MPICTRASAIRTGSLNSLQPGLAGNLGWFEHSNLAAILNHRLGGTLFACHVLAPHSLSYDCRNAVNQSHGTSREPSGNLKQESQLHPRKGSQLIETRSSHSRAVPRFSCLLSLKES